MKRTKPPLCMLLSHFTKKYSQRFYCFSLRLVVLIVRLVYSNCFSRSTLYLWPSSDISSTCLVFSSIRLHAFSGSREICQLPKDKKNLSPWNWPQVKYNQQCTQLLWVEFIQFSWTQYIPWLIKYYVPSLVTSNFQILFDFICTYTP